MQLLAVGRIETLIGSCANKGDNKAMLQASG